jgi:hypothetical protein
MKGIRNATRGPLAVPLPGGKKLHLGPGKTGEISPRAAEHPPLVALVEAGSLEIVETDAKGPGATTQSSLHGVSGERRPSKAGRRGDR